MGTITHLTLPSSSSQIIFPCFPKPQCFPLDFFLLNVTFFLFFYHSPPSHLVASFLLWLLLLLLTSLLLLFPRAVLFPMLALLLSSPFSRSSFPPSSSSFFSPRSPFPLWPNSSSSSSFSLSCETHNFSFFISRRRYINAHSFGRTVRLVIVFLVLFVPSLLWFFMFVFFFLVNLPMHACSSLIVGTSQSQTREARTRRAADPSTSQRIRRAAGWNRKTRRRMVLRWAPSLPTRHLQTSAGEPSRVSPDSTSDNRERLKKLLQKNHTFKKTFLNYKKYAEETFEPKKEKCMFFFFARDNVVVQHHGAELTACLVMSKTKAAKNEITLSLKILFFRD